ncbi:MAG TPA: GTPase Era, partial [Bdellovibrionota bacterium]|nr:GTPase Era [Bdellovibrionota bacterium]
MATMIGKSGVVALAGRPNSGKSTLLNRVMGEEISIVSPKAQTTREQLRGILNHETGQIVFVDTPGIHRAKAGGLNEAMVHQARMALDGPDVVWYLVDPASTAEHEEPVVELVAASGAPVLVLINKIDRKDPESSRGVRLGTDEGLAAFLSSLSGAGAKIEGVRRISALGGEGVPELMETTWALLPQGEPLYPTDGSLSDRPVRFFVAEKIREQIFRQLGEELPYSCAVEVQAYEEGKGLD